MGGKKKTAVKKGGAKATTPRRQTATEAVEERQNNLIAAEGMENEARDLMAANELQRMRSGPRPGSGNSMSCLASSQNTMTIVAKGDGDDRSADEMMPGFSNLSMNPRIVTSGSPESGTVT